jgi:hypothetical protein
MPKFSVSQVFVGSMAVGWLVGAVPASRAFQCEPDTDSFVEQLTYARRDGRWLTETGAEWPMFLEFLVPGESNRLLVRSWPDGDLLELELDGQ